MSLILIRVEARLYAILSKYRPDARAGDVLFLDLPEGATVRYALEEALCVPADEVKMVYVNGVARDFAHPLSDGDRIGIFPPIAGG